MFLFAFVTWCISAPSSSWIHSWSIGISYVQLISMFTEIDVPWTNKIYQIFSVLGFANFNINLFALECGDPNLNYWGKWYFRLFTPLIFLGMLISIYFLSKLTWAKGWNKHFNKFKKTKEKLVGTLNTNNPSSIAELNSPTINHSAHHIGGRISSLKPVKGSDILDTPLESIDSTTHRTFETRFIFSLVIIMDVLYTSLTQSASEVFNCKSQGPTLFVLRSEPSIICYDNDWNKHSVFAIIALMVYSFGIPIVFAIILTVSVHRGWLETSWFQFRFSAITSPYMKNLFFWEIISLAERGLVILIINLGRGNDNLYIRVNFSLWVLLVYVVFQVITAPYILQFSNRLRVIWNLLTVYWLYSSLVFDKLNDPNVLALELPGQSYHLLLFSNFLAAALGIVIVITLLFCGIEYFHNRSINLVLLDSKEKVEELDKRNEKLLKFLLPETGTDMWARVKRMKPSFRRKFMNEFELLARIDELHNQVIQPPESYAKPRLTIVDQQAAKSVRRYTIKDQISTAPDFEEESKTELNNKKNNINNSNNNNNTHNENGDTNITAKSLTKKKSLLGVPTTKKNVLNPFNTPSTELIEVPSGTPATLNEKLDSNLASSPSEVKNEPVYTAQSSTSQSFKINIGDSDTRKRTVTFSDHKAVHDESPIHTQTIEEERSSLSQTHSDRGVSMSAVRESAGVEEEAEEHHIEHEEHEEEHNNDMIDPPSRNKAETTASTVSTVPINRSALFCSKPGCSLPKANMNAQFCHTHLAEEEIQQKQHDEHDKDSDHFV